MVLDHGTQLLERRRGGTINEEPSLTKQSFRTEVDINQIIKRYDRDGIIATVETAAGHFIDTTGIPSYREALDTMLQIEGEFAQLPARVRAEYDNDPALWADMIRTADRATLNEFVEHVVDSVRPADRTPPKKAREASLSPSDSQPAPEAQPEV